MKKMMLVAAALGLMLTSCSKKPEDVVKESYDAANEMRWEALVPYVTPEGLEKLSQEEIDMFKMYMTAAMPISPVYTSLEIDTLRFNAAGDTAYYAAKTTFKDGVSYNESGTLRKDAKGNWVFALQGDNAYSIADANKYTPELMRNADYAMDMVLSTRGIPEYQCKAARHYFYGVMTNRSMDDYFSLTQTAANGGDLKAKQNLALSYRNGWGVQADKEKAFELDKELAEAGDALSMLRLGDDYSSGRGVMKDCAEAIKWYQKALEAGEIDAYNNLAVMYENGDGVQKDYDKAFELYSKGAEAGECYAMGNLGRCYRFGRGTEKDFVKAEEWMKKAIEGGRTYSENDLADLYYEDLKEYDKAFYLYKKLAANDNRHAEFMVGQCYEYGRGVDRNLDTAYEWYTKGWRKNYKPAVKAYDRLWYVLNR